MNDDTPEPLLWQASRLLGMSEEEDSYADMYT